SFYLKQAQKKQQSSYDGKVLVEKHDPPVVHNSEETLQLAQEIVSQDIISVVQNAFVVVPSDLQTELERTKEHFENCIIKKETEYAKEISRVNAKILHMYQIPKNQVFQKLGNANVELEFQDSSKNTKFAKQPIAETLPKIGERNAFSKTVTSNSVSTPQVSKDVNNAKVIAPGMFRICLDKVSREAKKIPNTDSSKNTKFAKQPIAETLPKIGERNAFSKTVTSNSVSTPQVSKDVNNAKVIAPGMFRICLDKVSREAKKIPNTGSITKFVYLVEEHHHLNPIFIPKVNSPRRLNDGVVMLVLEARGRPLRFGEVHLSLVGGGSSDLKGLIGSDLQSHLGTVQHHDSMPPSSWRWTVQSGVCGILPFGIEDESHPDEIL
nr:hypothetical protein [Tanacetum cinerariifolium]